jgi:hypothetical protein
MKKHAIPSLSSVSPAYAALLAKRVELRQEHSKLQHAVSKSAEEMYLKKTTGVNAKASDRVLVLLGEKDAVDDSSDRQRHTALSQKLADVTKALELIEDRIATERANASRLVTKAVEPAYKMIVGNIAKQLIQLHSAAQEYTDFKNAMDAEDVSVAYLHQMPLPLAHRIGPYLVECAANGFLKTTDIPKELR